MAQTRLSVRVNGANPDHHLFNNNGTWWVHFTVHRDDFTKQRIRRSLGTRCLAAARRLRDETLGHLATPGTIPASQLAPEGGPR